MARPSKAAVWTANPPILPAGQSEFERLCYRLGAEAEEEARRGDWAALARRREVREWIRRWYRVRYAPPELLQEVGVYEEVAI